MMEALWFSAIMILLAFVSTTIIQTYIKKFRILDDENKSIYNKKKKENSLKL
jgi:hypothetical protein